MNVFKVYLMPFFSVLNTTTQDSNTEISKLLFFQNITDLKICHNRNLGFVQPSEH